MKCPKCDHLTYPDEVHECPTEQYQKAHDWLVEAAARYDEENFLDEDGKHIER